MMGFSVGDVVMIVGGSHQDKVGIVHHCSRCYVHFTLMGSPEMKPIRSQYCFVKAVVDEGRNSLGGRFGDAVVGKLSPMKRMSMLARLLFDEVVWMNEENSSE